MAKVQRLNNKRKTRRKTKKRIKKMSDARDVRVVDKVDTEISKPRACIV